MHVQERQTPDVKIVFMGSPEFALPILRALAEQYPLVGVVTQPDRPAGRGKSLTPPPVKTLALQLGLPVIQPSRLSDPSALDILQQWQPDLIVVAAFGQILKPIILQLPKYGCLNVHASLLPRWRGAAPIPAAILYGDMETGVTIMQMDAGLDTGPILRQRAIPILDSDTTLTLTHKLSELGARVLLNTIPDYLHGIYTPLAQNSKRATYAPMLKKEDGELDFSQPVVHVWRKVRAYNPWPLAYTHLNNNPLLVLQATPIQEIRLDVPPGQTIIHNKKPLVACSDGFLELQLVQPAGKKPLSGRDFLNGYRHWGEVILPN
jgi:methionyl-tRNA formyltransferase